MPRSGTVELVQLLLNPCRAGGKVIPDRQLHRGHPPVPASGLLVRAPRPVRKRDLLAERAVVSRTRPDASRAGPAAKTSTASVTAATVMTSTADIPSTRTPARIPANSGADADGRTAASAHARTRLTAPAAAPAHGAAGFTRLPATASAAPPASGTAGSSQASQGRLLI